MFIIPDPRIALCPRSPLPTVAGLKNFSFSVHERGERSRIDNGPAALVCNGVEVLRATYDSVYECAHALNGRTELTSADRLSRSDAERIAREWLSYYAA